MPGSKGAIDGRMSVPGEKASANSVPAAAVIRRMRALSGFIGFKGCAGGLVKSAVKIRGSTPSCR